MTVALLKEPALTWSGDLGPYRLADYDRLPAEPRCELLFGRFYVSPSPSVWHQIVVFLLARRLDEIATRQGGLVLTAPMDVVLGEHSVVQPDILYVTAERREIVGTRIEGTPDLLIEVLSPGTARADRGEKLALYASSGVREYWIVDPAEKQIEFLLNRDGRFLVALPAGHEYRSEVLPEVELDLRELWQHVQDRLH